MSGLNPPVNMILADLPYQLTACKWDKMIPLELLWAQYKRLIKDNGAIVLTASQPFTSNLVMSNLEMFKYEWVWDKVVGSNFVHAKRMPLKVYENILIFGKGVITYNPQMTERKKEDERKSGKSKGKNLVNVKFMQSDTKGKKKYPTNKITINRLENELNSHNVLHPTQKPVALFSYLIRTYTNEEDTVLDNCMGSGTTLVAAKELGRKSIGIEIEEKYCEIAVNRIEKAIKHDRMSFHL